MLFLAGFYSKDLILEMVSLDCQFIRIFSIFFFYRFIINFVCLPVVLYGCKTWSLTLREECRLRVFENRILRRIFGPKRDENGSGEGSKMRNFIVCTVHLI